MTSKHDPKSDPKVQLRRAALNARRKVHSARAILAASALTERLCAELECDGKTIAGYWPLGDEIDCRPALEKFVSQGIEVALPVVAGQGQVLIFRNWTPGEPLETGPFGTSHPAANAPMCSPDILLLPLVAFDNIGQRLGYGAGYYDRTLAELRNRSQVLAIGIAYDEQEIEPIPAGRHDQRLDAVVTDQRALWFNGAAPRN